MSVDELETAVARLSPEELARFTEWFEEYQAQEWHRQIELGARAGRLDAAARHADDDFDAGRATPL